MGKHVQLGSTEAFCGHAVRLKSNRAELWDINGETNRGSSKARMANDRIMVNFPY